jgi:hypothetical protein
MAELGKILYSIVFLLGMFEAKYKHSIKFWKMFKIRLFLCCGIFAKIPMKHQKTSKLNPRKAYYLKTTILLSLPHNNTRNKLKYFRFQRISHTTYLYRKISACLYTIFKFKLDLLTMMVLKEITTKIMKLSPLKNSQRTVRFAVILVNII